MMNKAILPITLVAILIFSGLIFLSKKARITERGVTPIQESMPEASPEAKRFRPDPNIVPLPSPKTKGEMSLEEAISRRRSQRNFTDESLTLEELSQILWAAQGLTNKERGFRSAPSAGALYPLDVYVVVGEVGVTNLDSGVYHYLPENHSLENLSGGDFRNALMKVCLGQTFIADAPVSLVITAEYERTTVKYAERGERYVHMEAGHTAQNIYLQAASLGLGTVTVGAFDDEAVSEVLSLPQAHKPLYVMPLGHVR